MSFQLVEDAMGDARNAEAMAAASDIAYLPEAEAAGLFREQLGLTEARLISKGNTQVYIASNDEHIVVAFRGTEAPTSIEGLKDWLLTDALNLLIVPEGRLGTDLAAAGVGARFHQGFVNAIADVWEPVLAAVEAELKKKDRPLWVTGHSLGGALALFAAWLFQRKMINVHQIYTYGAPMIGNGDAARAFDRELKGKIFRYVNMLDPIPKLPTMSLIANQYGHCLTEIAFGEAAGGDFLQALAGAEIVLNASIIDSIWKALEQRVSAHAMDVYRKQLRR
jgi:predicted lipase